MANYNAAAGFYSYLSDCAGLTLAAANYPVTDRKYGNPKSNCQTGNKAENTQIYPVIEVLKPSSCIDSR